MKPLPGMFSDEALDPECQGEPEDDARLQHLDAWCAHHGKRPDQLTSGDMTAVWAAWREQGRGAA